MNVGDYVRTDRCYITKISDFKEHYTKGKRLELKEEVVENFLLLDDKQCEIIESIDYSIPPCYPSDEELEKIKSHIIKSSPNIIDLIEEHDLLKIEYKISDESIQTEVVEVIRNYQGILYVNTFVGKFFIVDLEHYNRKILSIVTKEQFSSMEYKVESEVK